MKNNKEDLVTRLQEIRLTLGNDVARLYRREVVWELLNDGYTAKEIAYRTGLLLNTVNQDIRSIKQKDKKIDVKEDESRKQRVKISSLYIEGLSIEEIAIRLRLDEEKAKEILEYILTLPDLGERVKQKHDANKRKMEYEKLLEFTKSFANSGNIEGVKECIFPILKKLELTEEKKEEIRSILNEAKKGKEEKGEER